jgi:hypothetical protein
MLESKETCRIWQSLMLRRDPMAALKEGSDQISAELIQAGGEILLSTIHKLINSVWNNEELPD